MRKLVLIVVLLLMASACFAGVTYTVVTSTSQDGETYRWQQESAIVAKGTPPGSPPGLIDPGVFAAEVAAYTKAGVFQNGAPSTDGTYNADMANGVVSGTSLIWPATGG